MFRTIDTTSYQQFLDELKFLLTISGIDHSRRQIFAGIDEKENKIGPSTKDYTPQIGRVILYIEEHLTKELSLEELAAEVGLSKYQLIRRFAREKGITPWNYLINRRIEKAKQLLVQGMPPGQVAVEIGFYDQSHLNKIFRDKTGYTPKEYQEENFQFRN